MRWIIIYNKLVEKAISNLTTQDLETFANKHNLSYTKDELIIIYQFIKYNYKELLNQNIKVFEEIKNKINPNLYKKLLVLYIEYKQKYL